MRSRHLQALITVGLVAGLCLAYLLLRPTPEREARRALDCLVSGDGECLSGLVRSTERKQDKIDGPSMGRLLQIMKRGEAEITRRPWIDSLSNGSAMACVTLDGPSMSPTTVCVTVVDTRSSEGIRLSEIVANIVAYGALLQRTPATEHKPSGLPYFRAIRDFIRLHLEELEATGIRGVTVFRPKGERFFTWREYLADRESLVSRFEANAKSSP